MKNSAGEINTLRSAMSSSEQIGSIQNKVQDRKKVSWERQTS
jgi:hypothetical protein